jgi:hypothetical protein
VFNMDLLRTRVSRTAEDSGGVQDNRVHQGHGERGSNALIVHQKLGVPTRLRVASLRFRDTSSTAASFCFTAICF